MSAGATLTLFLVRHAAHDRLGRVLSGRMPGVTLGECGRDQARRLAMRFANLDIAALYTSPLERAQETAGPIAAACATTAEVSEALTEIDFGDWTGRPFSELERDDRWRVWNEQRVISSPPRGESMSAVQSRAMNEIERWRVRHPGERVVAVSHCDVIKAVACGILGLSLGRYHAFEIEPASTTGMVLWQGGGKLLTLNEAVAP